MYALGSNRPDPEAHDPLYLEDLEDSLDEDDDDDGGEDVIFRDRGVKCYQYDKCYTRFYGTGAVRRMWEHCRQVHPEQVFNTATPQVAVSIQELTERLARSVQRVPYLQDMPLNHWLAALDHHKERLAGILATLDWRDRQDYVVYLDRDDAQEAAA